MKSLVIGLTSLLFAVGDSSIYQDFTNVERGWNSKHTQEISYVIKDKATWEEHYNKYHNDKAPEVDFSKEMVIGCYYGMRPTMGYKVEIKQLRKSDYTLEIFVEKTTPKPGHVYLEVITNSYHLIKTEKSDKEIFWVDEIK